MHVQGPVLALAHDPIDDGPGGIVDYEGELYARFTYRMARHAKLHKVPAPLALTCEAIDARCPGWRFSNTGGAQCRPGLHQSPKLLSQIFHHSEQQTFPLSVMYEDRSYAMVVESACFEGKRRRDPAECPANYSLYVAGLGVDARPAAAPVAGSGCCHLFSRHVNLSMTP